MAFGPFAFAPASELVGRRPVYITTALAFVALNAGTALSPNYASLIVLRFLAGAAGSTGPTLGSGVIGDMFLPRFRGRAVAVYGLGPLLGPVVGNLISGYIVQASHSFRWLLWTLTVISGVIALIITLFLRETFGPVLLARKRQRVAKFGHTSASSPPSQENETVQSRVHRMLQLAQTLARPWTWHASRDAKQKFRLAMSRPFRLLFGNPICAIFSLYQGFVYGVMFIFLTQHPLLFQQRTAVEDSGSGSGTGSESPANSQTATHTHIASFLRRQVEQAVGHTMHNGTSPTSTAHRVGGEHTDPNLHRLPSYGWSTGNAGLSYLGLGVGFLIAMSLNAVVNDWLYRRLVATEGRVTWKLFHPRIKNTQLAQETQARTTAHEVVHGTPPPTAEGPPQLRSSWLGTSGPGPPNPAPPDSSHTAMPVSSSSPPRSSNPDPRTPMPRGQPPVYAPYSPNEEGNSIRPASGREAHSSVAHAREEDVPRAHLPSNAEPRPPAPDARRGNGEDTVVPTRVPTPASALLGPSSGERDLEKQAAMGQDASSCEPDTDVERQNEKSGSSSPLNLSSTPTPAPASGPTPAPIPCAGQNAVAPPAAAAAATASPPGPPARKGQPEFRLPMCLLGMLILPCGLLLFGWSASAKTHWCVPLLGSLVTGAGLILCFQTILMYLVDAFIPYSASATACSVLTRSVLAACFPLFAEYLYAALGYGGGSTLLAGVALLGVPVPVLMFFYGQTLRTRFAFHG